MFSALFLDRPRLAIVLSILLAFCGGICLLNMPISEYPEITPPIVSVSATYAGATPQVLADTVATPIEDEVNGVDNLEFFDSRCSDTGAYNLYVTFKVGSDHDMNLVNVQNMVKRAEPKLPGEVVANGITIKKIPQDCMAQFAFTTDGTRMALPDLGNYVKKVIAAAVQRLDGVEEVTCSDREYAMRVWLNPLKMSAMGISVAEVKTAISQQNIQAAAGNVGGDFASKYLSYRINVKGRLSTPQEFGEIVVRTNPETGARVLLRDIARCELGSKRYSTSERFGDSLAVTMSVYKAPEANAVETADRVKAEVADWMKRLPQGVECHLADDTTAFTRAFLKETFKTLVIALVLVVVVTFLFLQNGRSTLIPAIAIPISLLGSFVFMLVLGYTLNVLTMFGLILVIGSLVDDAIIVIENAQSVRERLGLNAKEATRLSMKEITGAIVATLFVTLSCYIPLIFYKGMVGKMYLQFAVTMSVALIISAFVALTLSPVLCAGLLDKVAVRRSRLFAPVNALIDGGRAVYLGVVRRLVAHLRLSFVAFLVIVAAASWFVRYIPGAFLPEEDRGFVKIEVELSEGSSLERTCSVLEKLHDAVGAIPGVQSVSSTAGSSNIGKVGENHASVLVRLRPWDERKDKSVSQEAIMDEIRQRLDPIREASFTVMRPAAINGLGGYGGVCLFLCSIDGCEPEVLGRAASDLVDKARRWKGVKSSTTNFSADTPQLRLFIDRDKAQALGISASTIFSTLQSKLASFYVNDFNLRGGAYQVIVQGQADARQSIGDALEIKIPGKDGAMVPLSAVGRFEFVIGPRVIPRYNKMSMAAVIVNPSEALTSLQVVDMISENAPDPSKFALNWAMMNRQEIQSRGQIVWLMALAVIFAYLFLVAKYESWILPVPVMLSSFVAVAGAVFGLWLFGHSLSIYAQLGLIMLIELSAKNAILIVEFARVLHREGLPVAEAAVEAASRRYRAVMMTAWCFMFGVVPLVIATGAGANAQRAIGVTTLCGMVAATFVGLAFVPALYALFQREDGSGRGPWKKNVDV